MTIHCDRTCHGAEKVEAVAVLRCANCGKVFARCAACNKHPRTVQASMRAHLARAHVQNHELKRRVLPRED